jgi:hypothetical protein
MDQNLVLVFKQSLRSVVEVIKGRISRVEINVVNDNLKPGFEIENNLKPSFEMRSIRQLEEDEVIIISYLRLQEKALKSNSRHLKVMENLTQDILERMLEIHFYNILTSSDIKNRIVSFIVTKGFWLHAVLEKRIADVDSKYFEHELNDMEKKNVGLLFDVLEIFDHINFMRQKVNCLNVVEQMQNAVESSDDEEQDDDPALELIEIVCSECFDLDCPKCGLGKMRKEIFGMYPDERQNDDKTTKNEIGDDKSMRPFILKKDVINCVQEVYDTDGSFVATENGWLAQRKSGKTYKSYLYPIPRSTENDKVIFTFFPELKK